MTSFGQIRLILTVAFFASFVSKAQIIPSVVWAQQFGGTGADNPGGTATDASGNTINIGSFSGFAQFGSTNLTCTNLSSSNMYLTKTDVLGNIIWAVNAGNTSGSSLNSYSIGTAVVTDATGSIYATGRFSGSITFGSSTFQSIGQGYSAFLVKYAPTGAVLWARIENGSPRSDGNALALDNANNVLLVGTFTDMGFWATPSTGGGLSATSNGAGDCYLVKYTSQGTPLWCQTGGGLSSDYAVSVAVDSQNNVFMTGLLNGGGSFGSQALAGYGGADGYIAKYNPQGVMSWAQAFGGSSTDLGYDLVSDAGNIYLVGLFTGTASFGNRTLLGRGNTDGFLLKCSGTSGTGVIDWIRQVGGSDDDELTSIALAPGSNLYVGGTFRNSVAIGSQTLQSAGGTDIIVGRYDANGSPIWAKRFGGTADEYTANIAYGASSLLSFSCIFTGSVPFDSFLLTSRGLTDGVLLQMRDNVPLAVENAVEHSNVQVYPNPCETRKLTIKGLTLSALESLTLIDAIGNIVPTQMTLGENELKIPSNTPAGIYLLQYHEANTVHNRKVVLL